MAIVEVVTEDSPHLDEVKRLWRANRKTLGPYPNGAFAERAQSGEILAAIDDGAVVAYTLYYTSERHRRARLTHLCVDSDRRGEGLGRLLLGELRTRTASHKGIGLYCRRDYEAWNLWPRLGFVPISEKVGRSKDGHELTYFWLQHPHPTLFSPQEDDERLKVVIDSNIFLDFDDPARNGADETAGMTADWLQPLIEICVNDELYVEIFRNDDSEQRKDRLSKAHVFACLESNTDDFLAAQQSIRALLGQPRAERDESDQRHLARTVASDATVFVTRDEPVLKVADDVYDQHGLSVVRPAQLVARFEELRNERDYQRARLAGTPLQFRRASADASRLADHFQSQITGERKRDVVERLNRAFANPDDFECHLVESSDGMPLAIHVAETTNSHLVTVSTFRIANNVLNTRLAPTLARTLLAGIVQNCLRSGIHAVRVSDPCLTPVVTTALQLTGFFQVGDSWLKLSVINAHSVEDVAAQLVRIAHAAGIDDAEIGHVRDAITDSSFRDDIDAVLDMEHMLWPGKFICCNVPNYVVAIEPRWASDLFDAGLARGSLWGAETELALNPDSVYYRATRPPMADNQGRILWYVSQDNRIQGSKSIRACSQLRGAVVGGPKELFRRFRRFGVYQWQHVLGTAGSFEGQLMALQFRDTELFSNRVGWDEAQSILRQHNIRSTFQSPTPISEAAFLEIYCRGLSLHANK